MRSSLAKEADRRYQSTADMVVDLESLSDKLKSGRSTILQAQAVSQATTTQPLATAQSPAGPLARYRVMKLLKTGRVAGCDWTANGRRSRQTVAEACATGLDRLLTRAAQFGS